MRHSARALTLAAATALGAACTNGPLQPAPAQDGAAAAAEFARLADSLAAAGNVDLAGAYRDLVSVIPDNGQVSPVVITVDGVPTEFLAAAREIDFERTAACAEPGSLCLMAPPLRHMVAWQKSNPRRVVHLAATPGGVPAGTVIPGAISGAFLNASPLTYFDGAGGVFVGSDGERSISDPSITDTPCREGTPPTILPGATCRRAGFTVSFSGTVAPPPFPVFTSSGAGTHTLAMAAQAVAGAQLILATVDCGPCTGYPKPIILTSSLTASVAPSGVTLTLAITNPLSVPMELRFSSAQQYDFHVRRADGTHAWTWSADKLFALALASRTVAPGETVSYVEQWTSPQPGSYLARGSLTSSSHFASATASFVVP